MEELIFSLPDLKFLQTDSTISEKHEFKQIKCGKSLDEKWLLSIEMATLLLSRLSTSDYSECDKNGTQELVTLPEVPNIQSQYDEKEPKEHNKLIKIKSELTDESYKLIIVGHSGAGKSSIIKRFLNDPRNLNKAIKRSHYPLPSFENVKSRLNGSCYFSTLDTSSGFWMVPLDEEKVFHRVMTEHFSDIDGVFLHVDDLIIYAKNKEQHDFILKKVFERAPAESTFLRDLLKKNSLWQWDESYEKAFSHLKNLISKFPVLSYFDCLKPITLSVDASQNAVGAVLLHDSKPCAYASKVHNR
ncbi:Uncharacterized protein FWK35_00024492 [Aphis craccivora]|uniref:Reverse transcriptase/retrotransposon-derived protein RNase H-like domain-containing protein n=1 Tax=Aphis craccivora TaxID=307492 RepID=A0A6G0WR26_APHCR|nr:Uncharacterized protein FWK35_00024492 [Aphis craccivora]